MTKTDGVNYFNTPGLRLSSKTVVRPGSSKTKRWPTESNDSHIQFSVLLILDLWFYTYALFVSLISCFVGVCYVPSSSPPLLPLCFFFWFLVFFWGCGGGVYLLGHIFPTLCRNSNFVLQDLPHIG